MFENISTFLIPAFVKAIQMKLSNKASNFFEFKMLY
jgi:hypothetical protein